MGGSHGFLALLPAERANLSVLLKVLEGIHHADSFLYGAAQRHVVHHHVAHYAVLVDEEEAAVGHELALDAAVTLLIRAALAGQHVELLCHFLVDVCHKRVGYALNTALIKRGIGPCPVAVFRIRGATHYHGVALAELFQRCLEAHELRGADEGEILGVEEEYHVLLADVAAEAEIRDDFAVDDCGGLELRCFLSD